MKSYVDFAITLIAILMGWELNQIRNWEEYSLEQVKNKRERSVR